MGEVAGGFLNPTGLVLKGVGSLTDFGTKAIKSLRKEGKELQAAEIMQEMLVEAGEDVDSVISALGRADEVKLTSGAKTGSPSLLAMERQLAAKNSEFSNLSEQIVKDAQEDIYKKINSLSKTGNPNDLRMASVAYDEFFDDLLMQKVSLAQKEASEALAKMSRGGTKASASVQAQNAIEKSLKDVRSVENALWSQIPKDVPLPQMSGMTNAFNKVRGELLAEEVVPFEKTFNRFMRKGVATVGDMVQLRKRLLAKARDLRANQKYDDARIHSELAGGVLRDLDSLDIPLATEARSFSRTLNDVFTRTFANKAKTRGATGELRLMPEMFLEGAFGSGGTKARVNFEALQKAARMGDASASYMGAVDDTSVGLLGSGLGGDVLNAQERFLAILANQTAKDGSINQAALNKFLNANSELLAKFPELKADIVDAKKAQELYERTVGLTKQASGAIGRRAAFSKVAGTENTVKAIGSILSGPEPTKRIGQLARLAKKSGEGASDGLYSAILEDSLNKSRTVDGVDFAKLQRLINNPISKGQPSINSLIKSNKIVSPDTTKRFDELVAKAVEVQDAIKSGKRLDEVIGDPDGVFDLVVRIAGANLGSMGAVGQGSPLIAGAAGSKFLRNIFHKVPASRLTDVLIEASVNPKFAQALLKKAPPMKQRAAYEKQINAFLLQSGIIEEEE